MNLQRATSSFDFLLPSNLQAERTQTLVDYIESRAERSAIPRGNP